MSLSETNPVDEFVKDRENPYSIQTELEIRKEIEDRTGCQIETHRNDDPYGWDLIVYGWFIKKDPDTNGNLSEKKHILNIEIEVASPDKWGHHWPPHWKTFSYLRRKIDVFDYNIHAFTDKMKSGGDDTIYLKLNYYKDDGHCNFISDIKDGLGFITVDDYQPGTTDIKIIRAYSYYRIRYDAKNYPIVNFGYPNCMDFICKSIEERKELIGLPMQTELF